MVGQGPWGLDGMGLGVKKTNLVNGAGSGFTGLLGLHSNMKGFPTQT